MSKRVTISHQRGMGDKGTDLNFVVSDLTGSLGRFCLHVKGRPGSDGLVAVFIVRGNKTHHIEGLGTVYSLEDAREIWTALVRRGAVIVDNPLVLGAKVLKTRKPSGAVTVSVDFETAGFEPVFEPTYKRWIAP